ncbi:invasion associated locus B family protein [Candidatus Pelagibacter sp.]|nr:invasion associated locus B family protein [Candidatus Pelagibacter sp.]
MSIIKKIILTLPIIFIAWCSQLSAEEIKKIGKYKDWEAIVVTSDTGKFCFAQSLPVLQGPKSNNKRDAKLFISFWPSEKTINEISVTAGYEFNSNSVIAQSGKNKFKFDIKKQGFAWIADTKVESRMIKKMKKGSRIMITGHNQKGSQTIDHYSLLGFTKAYNTIKKACS